MKVQPQANKSAKKASKRRNRNKRRRKLRQQRKFQVTENKTYAPTQKYAELQPEDRNRRWEALCLETFQRLTIWQSEAELNFWKARTDYLQKENKQLKLELESIKMNTESNQIEEQDNVDADYLEFIAITQKHREELRRARESKNESVIAPDSTNYEETLN